MSINKRVPNIIEVKKDANKEQIDLLQKMNPYSLILREDDIKLKLIYDDIAKNNLNYNDYIKEKC